MRLDTRFLSLVCVLGLAAGCAAETDKGPADTTGLSLVGGGAADGAGPYAGALSYDERVTDGLDRWNPYDVWDVEGGCDDAFIDLASREGGDTYLLLYVADGTSWHLVDTNDDCYGGTLNSCLEVSLDAGQRYRVVASSYDYLVQRRRPTFGYELEVFCRDTTDPTGQICGTRGAEPCPEGFYCQWPESAMCGWADAPGTCQAIPDVCPLHYAPVCGCDGNTHSNTCFANRQGVSVLHVGACEPVGQGVGETCGGIATLQCAEGLRCDYSGNVGCDIADVAGVCVVDEPVACTREYAPVCGCDGVTYGNECMRRAAGVALDHEGECRTGHGEGEICGGIAGFLCAEGLRCDMSANTFCGADLAGVCVADEPVICTAEYNPVCGCDGVTYSNDCRRRAAGVPLAHPGAC